MKITLREGAERVGKLQLAGLNCTLTCANSLMPVGFNEFSDGGSEYVVGG